MSNKSFVSEVLAAVRNMEEFWSVPALVVAIGNEWSEPDKLRKTARAYSFDPRTCITGSTYREVEGSTCEGCYGFEGRCAMPLTLAAMDRRLRAWKADPVKWTAAQIVLMRRRKPERFRWFDVGDIQSMLMLEALVTIAEEVPGTRFWLPTKEWKMINKWGGTFPENLCVRLSHPMREQLKTEVSTIAATRGVQEASVEVGGGYKCPATYGEMHQCVAYGCTACWDYGVQRVDYKWHSRKVK